MKQLKYIQGKSPIEPKYTLKTVHPPRLTSAVTTTNTLGQVKSSPSNKSGKATLNIGKSSSTNSRKKYPDVRIKKGDMAEFLKRKEQRQQSKTAEESPDEDLKSSESSGRLRDVGCQTIESNLAQKLAESAKLTMLYPKKEIDDDHKLKASGDSGLHRSPPSSNTGHRTSEDMLEFERNHSRLNSILERKDTRDPYLPTGKIFYTRFVIFRTYITFAAP
jgi:hypothetical protein